jgi:hypothetical protein
MQPSSSTASAARAEIAGRRAKKGPLGLAQRASSSGACRRLQRQPASIRSVPDNTPGTQPDKADGTGSHTGEANADAEKSGRWGFSRNLVSTTSPARASSSSRLESSPGSPKPPATRLNRDVQHPAGVTLSVPPTNQSSTIRTRPARTPPHRAATERGSTHDTAAGTSNLHISNDANAQQAGSAWLGRHFPFRR